MNERTPLLPMPLLDSMTKKLIFVNVAAFAAVFVLNVLFRGADGPAPVTMFLAVSWQGLWEGFGLGLLRLVTYQFTHSFADPWHIAMNMLVLYWFGRMVESEVGGRGLLNLYLVSGAIGAVVQITLGFVLAAGDMPTVGASGACYGIMVYAACMAPRVRTLIGIELGWLVGILVAIGIYMTLLEILDFAPGQGVANGGHLGGALWGFVAFRRLRGYYLRLGHDDGPWLPWLQRWRADRTRRSEHERRQRLDQLLDKIKRDGMPSLTGDERRFLERVSRDRQGNRP